MKKWNFKLKNNPKEISENIKSTFGSINGFVVDMNHDKNNSTTFKMRKRILYPWYLLFLNSIVVNGKLLKTDTENETDVEISFKQHFLWRLVIFANLIVTLGFLITVISGKNNSIWTYLIGTVILAVIILIWIIIRNKYEKNVKEYKILISGILET